jgi:His/Glu/Gln/Arg/opine family amino acid ABC transporter permease subunit
MGGDVPASFWAFSSDVVIPRLLLGFVVTLKLTIASGFFGILLGLALALLRLSPVWIFRKAALVYVTLFRGTPLLLQILFFYFALPPLLNITWSEMTCGVLALSLNAGAYLAEIFRAAILSIDKGQVEAAKALGLSPSQSMRLVVLPQTYRRLIPPIVNELAALAKDTSLVSVVSLAEVLYITQRIGATYLRPWEAYVWAAVGYLIIVICLSTIAMRLEARLERRGG